MESRIMEVTIKNIPAFIVKVYKINMMVLIKSSKLKVNAQ